MSEENDFEGLRSEINDDYDDLGYKIEKSFENDDEDNMQLGASGAFKVNKLYILFNNFFVFLIFAFFLGIGKSQFFLLFFILIN